MTLHKSPDSPLSWLNALTASKPTAGPILQFRQKLPPPTAYQRAPRLGSTNGKGRPAGAGGGKKRIGRNGCGWHIKVQGGTNLLWHIFNFPEWAFLGAQHLLWAKAFLSWGPKVFLMVCPSPVWNWITGDSCRAALCYNQPIQGESRPKMGSCAPHYIHHTSLNKQTRKEREIGKWEACTVKKLPSFIWKHFWQQAVLADDDFLGPDDGHEIRIVITTLTNENLIKPILLSLSRECLLDIV